MIEAIEQYILEVFHLSISVQVRLAQTAVILIVLIILRAVAFRFAHKKFLQDTRQLYNWRKFIEYIIVFTGFILIGRIWIASMQSLITYAGLLSAGIAIALQDLIISLAGWMFIMWRKPFIVGDRIQIGDYTGDIIDTRLFEFSMLEIGNWVDADQSTGRIIHIPNSHVFTDVFANYSQGFSYIWEEIPIMVTFESDWEKAKAILTRVVQQKAPHINRGDMRRAQSKNPRFIISYSNLAPTVYTSVANSGVVLTLRYLVDPMQRRVMRETVWEAILRAFAKHEDIDLAYETQREYNHHAEKRLAHRDKEKKSVKYQDEPVIGV